MGRGSIVTDDRRAGTGEVRSTEGWSAAGVHLDLDAVVHYGLLACVLSAR